MAMSAMQPRALTCAWRAPKRAKGRSSLPADGMNAAMSLCPMLKMPFRVKGAMGSMAIEPMDI